MYRFETCSHIIYYNDGRSISYAWYKSASVLLRLHTRSVILMFTIPVYRCLMAICICNLRYW